MLCSLFSAWTALAPIKIYLLLSTKVLSRVLLLQTNYPLILTPFLLVSPPSSACSANKLPLDVMMFTTEVTTKSVEQVTEPAPLGCYIYGLCIEGAR
jgi:hypothetical protein